MIADRILNEKWAEDRILNKEWAEDRILNEIWAEDRILSTRGQEDRILQIVDRILTPDIQLARATLPPQGARISPDHLETQSR